MQNYMDPSCQTGPMCAINNYIGRSVDTASDLTRSARGNCLQPGTETHQKQVPLPDQAI